MEKIKSEIQHKNRVPVILISGKNIYSEHKNDGRNITKNKTEYGFTKIDNFYMVQNTTDKATHTHGATRSKCDHIACAHTRFLSVVGQHCLGIYKKKYSAPFHIPSGKEHKKPLRLSWSQEPGKQR